VTTECYAAAITPLKDGGSRIDDGGIAEYVRFLAEARLDGVMVTGTAGEGLLLAGAERRQVAEQFIAAAPSGFRTLVQCGAQTTSETTDLAGHAAAVGAAGVLVICPPYFPLDAAAQHAFLGAAAAACAPVPFGVYELARASGYAVSHDVIGTLREEHPNFEMIKISDTPWESFSEYLQHGLRAFCGPEGLIGPALRAGAAGAISALAAAFPHEVVRAVRERDEDQFVLVQRLRACLDRFPRQAALKALLRENGVPIEETVRPPLRALTRGERMAVIGGVHDLLGRAYA
jgi:dihydrodipicolinate synthase/N-acetylneuraminate lyase